MTQQYTIKTITISANPILEHDCTSEFDINDSFMEDLWDLYCEYDTNIINKQIIGPANLQDTPIQLYKPYMNAQIDGQD